MAKIEWIKRVNMIAEVKPCFNCGNEKGLSLQGTMVETGKENKQVLREMVYCPVCNSIGPACDMPEKSFIAWNALTDVWKEQEVEFGTSEIAENIIQKKEEEFNPLRKI